MKKLIFIIILGMLGSVFGGTLQDIDGLTYNGAKVMFSDGSVAFSGDVDFGGNSLDNVGEINNIYYVEPNNAEDIQTKIDLASANGGGKVVIPGGTYILNEGIRITNDRIYIEGSGAGTIIKQADGANINYMFYFGGSSYSSISNLYLDGNKANQGGGDGRGLYIYSSARFKADNLWIWDTYGQGIRMEGGSSSSSSHASQWNNIMIYGTGGDSINLAGFAYDSQFNNVWIGYAGDDGVDIGSGNQVFNNLHIWSSTNNGVKSRWNLHRFNNCYIEHNGGKGFDLYDSDYVTINNCFIWANSNKGVLLQSGEGNIITNSNIYNNTDSGVAILPGAENNKINNNNIYFNQQHGIDLQSNKNEISSNTIYMNERRGISASSANQNIVSGNSVSNNGVNLVTGDRKGIAFLVQATIIL